jgi:hypothetical protein
MIESVAVPSPRRIFLLSPAHCGGKRAGFLLNDAATFDLARRLCAPGGAPLGEVFSFLSGLYFRGKVAYARAFANPPRGMPGALVITSNRGLIPPETPLTVESLRDFGCTDIATGDPRYREPLERDAHELARKAGGACEVVLLGSVATPKYVEVLRAILGDRLRFPAEFAGRGDMSRGGLMLRCVDERRELTYVPIDGSPRRGTRPPKLTPRRRVTSPAQARQEVEPRDTVSQRSAANRVKKTT